LDYLATQTSLSPIRRGFAPGFVNYKNVCTRLAAASDKVYQSPAHGRWISPGNSASSTTQTGRHDIAEILLKVALNIKIIDCCMNIHGVISLFKRTANNKLVISVATGKLYHLRLRVECTRFCNLQSRARTHAVLVIGLFELLGNPTTQLIEPPGPLQQYRNRFQYIPII
jgi:hypothetical protein